MDTNLKIIERLRNFLSKAKASGTLYFMRKEDFTRDRKLSFERVVSFLVNLPKKSLSVELAAFYKELSIRDPEKHATKSAFSQARKKLKPFFFEDWSNELVSSYYQLGSDQIKHWMGFRVQGVDGSTFYMFKDELIIEEFGSGANQYGDTPPLARAMVCYDVLNHLCVFSHISPYDQSELQCAEQWVSSFCDNSLTIYDRGFPSFTMFYLHNYYQKHFVIRCKLGFSKVVQDFVESESTSRIVELEITDDGIKKLTDFGLEVNRETKTTVRLVKVLLDTGETEVLITSLLDEEKFPVNIFKDLYFMRWGAETFYDRLKNTCQANVFSGVLPLCIKQDFYATIFTANLHGLIVVQAQERIESENSIKNRKHSYHINWNVSLGNLKNEIIRIFLLDYPEDTLEYLVKLFQKNIEPVRPDRKFERSKSRYSPKIRYYTQTSHKRAI